MYEEIYNRLKKYNQLHLLSFYEELNNEEKESLLKQISSIDFEMVNKLYSHRNEPKIANSKIEPIIAVDRQKFFAREKKGYEKKGIEIIKKDKYAVVTMAGGMGSRLGHNGPKGTFMLGLTPDKSLFEIFCNQLKKAKEDYGVSIPWYIMTSEENEIDTEKFFEDNSFFDYGKENIKFFKQGGLPVVNISGKVILSDKGKIQFAADGNGGIFEAMLRMGIIADMKAKGIEWVYIVSVDNPLIQMVDPLFIGYNAINELKIGTISIIKNCPTEKVGVFCKMDGKPRVIEYSELPDYLAELRNEMGELVYGDAHIMMNMFNMDILESIGKQKMPYHSAYKRVPYITADGEHVDPKDPNAYKFEAFIFDAFSMVDDLCPVRMPREDIFAPVKNRDGVDSPETARKLYKDYWNKN